jgi:hypothetical protein
MKSHEHFVSLREEIESIDEYLDIEVVRFGPSLRVRKDISPDTARHRGAEHDPAAAGRERDQSTGWRARSAPGRSPSAAAASTAAPSSKWKTTAWGSCSTGSINRCRAASAWPTCASACA